MIEFVVWLEGWFLGPASSAPSSFVYSDPRAQVFNPVWPRDPTPLQLCLDFWELGCNKAAWGVNVLLKVWPSSRQLPWAPFCPPVTPLRPLTLTHQHNTLLTPHDPPALYYIYIPFYYKTHSNTTCRYYITHYHHATCTMYMYMLHVPCSTTPC